jgi:hypothetical protein
VVNWDSGQLKSSEVLAILEAFSDAADGDLAGMDVVGDWSPVQLHGLTQSFLHWTEHPALDVNANEAARRNEAFNLRLLDSLSCVPQIVKALVSDTSRERRDHDASAKRP